MAAGALVDSGIDPQEIEKELRLLKIEDEYGLLWEKVVKKGISATKMNVLLKKQDIHEHQHQPHDHHHEQTPQQELVTATHMNHYHSHSTSIGSIDHSHHGHSHSLHDHNHDHHHFHTHDHKAGHRHYRQIVELISSSELSGPVKEIALKIFAKIAVSEGKIHNIPLEDVHFHEVGAIDSIIDVVAAAVAIDRIKPDKIISSAIPVGSGKIKIDHGIYPVPAPATLDILKNIPLQTSNLPFELTTPTGAGIIAALVDEFSTIPSMTVRKIGYGAGTRDLPDRPNVLRVLVGDME